MTILLFDTPQTHQSFYPLSLTRPVAFLRHGIFTLQERWQFITGKQIFAIAENYLQLPAIPQDESYLYIDAAFLPEATQHQKILALATGESMFFKERLVAVKTENQLHYPLDENQLTCFQKEELPEANFLQFPWHLFQTNARTIVTDYELITQGRATQPMDATNIITGGTAIFLEAGAEVKGCFINASEGPVYIGKNALVMEGTAIRGPVAIGEKAVVKMGTRLYGGTTIGPNCTAGGEIKNAIFTGYSNKAHDGYLGDAVLGEWCNLGAGTTNSNVKNTAGDVKLWSDAAQEFVSVGKKAGLIMGDYSRSAVNTSFNTGTVVGVCCNIFGNNQPPKHLPSFTWGMEKYLFEKALGDIDRWKQMKGKRLKEEEKNVLKSVYGNAG